MTADIVPINNKVSKSIVIAIAILLINLFFVSVVLAQTITTGTITGSPFCSGTTVLVPYTTTGTFNAGNLFTAQLSDASGSFTSKVDIGTLSTTSGTINGTIPVSTATGTGYRIRVVSSNPAITGTDNGSDISIHNTPTITGTTPGSNCGTGTIVLGATASAGTINWYDISTGGTSLGTGTSFTTPVISTTTTYYVDATDLGCTTASRTAIVATINTQPIASITGLDSMYSSTDPPVTLTGNPSGGTFTGNGITGNQYDPALAGLGYDTVVYAYTSPQGCSDQDTAITYVHNYDYKAGALIVPHTDDWSSANAAYTTVGGTPDEQKGSAWFNGPNYNRWFMFQATTTQVKVEVKVGGAEGTMLYPFVALWDSSGTEIQSAAYYSTYSDISVGSVSLTPGDWYYISVDNSVGTGNRGTFTLALDNEADYDFREGAIVVPHTDDWCSADAAYTTINASPDGDKGSAWPNGPNYNRWFRFQATTTQVKVDVKVGGAEGSMRNPFIALWDSTGNEIQSAIYYSSTSDIYIQSDTLTIGEWYYISVDNSVGLSYRGTFTLCVDYEVDYDFRGAAIVVPHTDDWCSADAAYTTLNASPDGDKGSAWPNGPNYNRWFRFQATTTQVKVDVKVGGAEGSMRNPFIALWDSTGNEIQSAIYYSSTSDIYIQSDTLTIGEWYYISVDNYVGLSYRGTFTLCVDNEVDYDFRREAIVVPHTDDWCSADAAYTTLNASPDGEKGSAWNNGPNYNRWFRFQATTTEVNAYVKVGGAEGSMNYPFIALWDSIGNEIQSKRYYSSTSDINVQSDTLTIGEWYYISVDNHVGTGYRGTFTLCVDYEVDYDFRKAAIVVPHINDWCSADAAYTTLNASPDEQKGSAWTNGPNYNRWFRFQANTTQVKVEVKVGGAEGTMNYPFIALWDSIGNEIQSARYYSSTSDINVQSLNLTIGEWYYVSVDNHVGSSHQGSFTLCVDHAVDYDYKEAAIVVPHTDDWCSANAAYTTLNATPDGVKGSAWNNGPNYNRWFMFQATTTQVNAEVKIGGVEGTMNYPFIALWDSIGNEIQSARYYSSTGDINVQSLNLTVGEWYYISVDNHVGTNHQGSFTLCVDFEVDYDFREGAIIVPHTDDWCSANAAFTTINASPDGVKGSAWTNGPNYNRWFRFQATTTQVNTEVKIGGAEGTMNYPFIALWDSIGNEIQSARYYSSTGDINCQSVNLIVGEWYYISVDNLSGTSHQGSFTLCVDYEVDYDFKEGAKSLDHRDWCSADAEYTTINASPDRVAGSNWINGPNYNRWFKFQATTPEISAELKTGGAEGTLDYGFIAIFNEEDIELVSDRYVSATSDVLVTVDTMTIGNWYYIVIDNLAGTSNQGSFSLCILNPFYAEARGTNVSCYGLNDGAIEVYASGGTFTTYSYSWTYGGAPFGTDTSYIDGLSPGLYEITVTDDGSGAFIVTSYEVTEEPPLALFLTSTLESCAGGADGTVTAHPSGGTETTYLFEWYYNNVLIGDTTQVITNKTAGWYKVIVTDAEALTCNIMDSIEVTVNPYLVWTGDINTDWNETGNWPCNIIPDITTLVQIPDVPNKPVLSSGAVGAVDSLIIDAGSSLTVSGNTLQIAGTITNNGTFDATLGTIELKGSSAQSIPANLFVTNTIEGLIINNAAGATLQGALNVTGIVSATTGDLAANGNLTLVSSAGQTALVDGSGTGEITGNVTMQRYLPSGFGYKYFSSPFQAATVNEFGDDMDLGATFPTFYEYDESRTSSGWVDFTTSTNTLNPMEGYAVNFGDQSDPKTVDVTGTINDGSMQVTLYNNNNTYTQGFNLVGNPYPSPIDWDAASGWTKTNIDDALYFFEAGTTDQYLGTYSSYINGVSSDGVADNLISSLQGFFVHVSDGSYPVTGTLGFSNSVRTNDLSPAFFKNGITDSHPLVRINADFSDNTAPADPMVIYFDNGTTRYFEPEKDALKRMNTDTRVPNFYLYSNDTRKLSISGMPYPADDFEKIPAGLITEQDGWISFYASEKDMFPSDLNAYLVDAETGMTHNLNNDHSYNVYLEAGEYNSRFYLVFSDEEWTNPFGANELFTINRNGDQIIVLINLQFGEKGILRMINTHGQVSMTREVFGNEVVNINSEVSSGVYIFSLFSEKDVYSKKLLMP